MRVGKKCCWKKARSAAAVSAALMAALLFGPRMDACAEEIPYAATLLELKADAASQKFTVAAKDAVFEKTMAEFGTLPLVVLDKEDGTRIVHMPDTGMLDAFVQEVNTALLGTLSGDAFYYYDEQTGTFQTYPGAYFMQINEAGKAQIYQGFLEAAADRKSADRLVTVPENGFDKVYAEIPEEILKNRYGLKGSCTTSLKGSSSNRISNIQIAVSQIDKFVLLPGQEVSMNELFLPRTRANGYKEAGAYLNGKTVPAIGGGICQASSTIYNAAMNSGLTVLERHAHSMSVSYLPLGMDAAISSGSKDLKLRNDYPFPVLFEGIVKGKNVTINVYTNELLTAGMGYRLHAVRTGSLSAKSYLEVSLNGVVLEDRFVAASRYNPHLPDKEENED